MTATNSRTGRERTALRTTGFNNIYIVIGVFQLPTLLRATMQNQNATASENELPASSVLAAPLGGCHYHRVTHLSS